MWAGSSPYCSYSSSLASTNQLNQVGHFILHRGSPVSTGLISAVPCSNEHYLNSAVFLSSFAESGRPLYDIFYRLFCCRAIERSESSWGHVVIGIICPPGEIGLSDLSKTGERAMQ